MKFTPHCSYNLKTRCRMCFGNVICFRIIPMYAFTKEALKHSTCTTIVAFIPVESVIKCCFKLYADESSMADIFRYCMGWANETMKFNEVHSRKSRLLCSGHCTHLKSKSGMEKSEMMSNYVPPLSVWNLRCLLYLLLQDMCTWWVVRLWHGTKVMFCQCFNCQSATSCTPLKTNMKPKKRYIPNRKGKSF